MTHTWDGLTAADCLVQDKLDILLVKSAGKHYNPNSDRHYHYQLVGHLEPGFLTYQLRWTPACLLFFPGNLDLAVTLLCSDGWNSYHNAKSNTKPVLQFV